MKKTIFFFILFLSTTLSAQYIVTGKVIHATTGDPIEMATVVLYQGNELKHGTQADLEGNYYFQQIAEGTYTMRVSSVGFEEKEITLEVSPKKANSNKVVTVATVSLKESLQVLGEVDVKGQAAEMTVKGDTIEYNTAAYKVGENAMVEDLLKKMNGVEVDKEGNVTINGEQITGVRIDGKKFFGDDVQSATKNIPAEMIDKIQVIDEKSETAKMTGFEDDETERIINLTLKENRKKGMFGNYNGGIGADMVTANEGWFNYADPAYGATAGDRARHFFQDDFRYTAGVFTNLLLGESQTTIIGSANNTNEIRSGRGRGSFSGNNTGITWSENLGVNTNIDLNKHITKRDNQTSLIFGGDATFNHSYNTTVSSSEKESYSGDDTYANTDSTNKVSHAWDVQARFELEYQIDTFNKIIVQPRITYTNGRSDNHTGYTYTNGSNVQMSNGYQNRFSNQDEIGARVRVNYNHKFFHPGRSLTLTGNVEFTDVKGKTDTYAYDNLGDSAKVNQNTSSGNDAVNLRLRASYVEPIYGKNHFLETVLMFGTNLRQSKKDQYDYDLNSSTYVYSNDYSNRLTNRFYQQSVGLNYRYIKDQIDLTVGAQFNPSQTRNLTYYGDVLHRDTTIYAWNWSPNMRFRYNFGKKEFARIFYRGTNTQPSVTQMEPVRNNSNAMNETVGNLGLKPAFRHQLHAMYSKFNQEKFWSVMAGLHGNVTQDALVNNSIYDETGKLYQQTVNAQGIPWDVSGDVMFNTPFANKLMQFHTRTEVRYNQRLAYLSREQTAATINQWLEQNTFGLGQESRTGNLRLSESLTLRFTHDLVDIGIVGSVTYSRTQNSLTGSSVTNVTDWTVTGDMQWHLPKSWNISADCGYTARYGYTGLTDVNEVLLNASVDKTWGFATLSLKAFDILHQKKNILQTVGENYVQYVKANTLPTYFLLTFTYKFNRMGDLKAQGMGGYMQEMIESGGNPMRGGMPMPPMR